MDTKYCNKCIMKEDISNIDIFNIINKIINSSLKAEEVYSKIANINIPFNKWLEFNEDGYNIFQWYAWFISTNIKKNLYLKPKVFAFFQKVFGIRSIFNKGQIKQIINCGTLFDQNHTLLYHLVRYCENPNDTYYKQIYSLLIDNQAIELTEDQLKIIANINTEEEYLPDNLKIHINDITNKYKYIEKLIIDKITTNYVDYKFCRCIKCDDIINFIREMPKIIEYAKTNNHILLLNMIWFAYYQRKLLNKLFDKYYKIVDSKSYVDRMPLNKIHSRHGHILKEYEKYLIN